MEKVKEERSFAKSLKEISEIRKSFIDWGEAACMFFKKTFKKKGISDESEWMIISPSSTTKRISLFLMVDREWVPLILIEIVREEKGVVFTVRRDDFNIQLPIVRGAVITTLSKLSSLVKSL